MRKRPLILTIAMMLARSALGASQAPAPKKPPKDIAYAKNSIEFSAIETEVYREAWRVVQAKAAAQKSPWAVVLDIDETVIDNAAFQEELGNRPFSQAAWDAWAKRGNAKALAGAKTFLDKVRGLARGRIVFMTDRDDGEKAATLKNLREQGLFKNGDMLLTKSGPADTKEVRRECVEKAQDPRCKASGPRAILALFGDSARDFIELYGRRMQTQGRRDILKNAGRKYFILPNPMYGQWQNDYR
ncbi:MAG: HAD family acid phosphatase [Elusimicrobiota bacterium]